MSQTELALRYGVNPHQVPARVVAVDGGLPITVLNGAPGYINLLDALNSWQLVHELRQSLDLSAAASFKHVSPAGAAVAVPLTEAERKSCFLGKQDLSPLAVAYARARGADRVSSFGDFIALSDRVDLSTAKLIRSEVSDGIIAPGFDDDALELLRQKQKGRYLVIQADPAFQPAEIETRDVFGVRFEQRRNDRLIVRTDLTDVVTADKDLTESAARDLIVALIALKYTQSNSVCYAINGQVIGMGAGQQSRIHCTRLAGGKADQWYLRQHPVVASLKFREDLGRPERDNAVDGYLLGEFDDGGWETVFAKKPTVLTAADKREWLSSLTGVSFGSDAFIPFRDNIDRAAKSGVKYIAQPGGSLRDQGVIDASDAYGMVMAFTGVRLFHH